MLPCGIQREAGGPQCGGIDERGAADELEAQRPQLPGRAEYRRPAVEVAGRHGVEARAERGRLRVERANPAGREHRSRSQCPGNRTGCSPQLLPGHPRNIARAQAAPENHAGEVPYQP
jgi:hypothetical protein